MAKALPLGKGRGCQATEGKAERFSLFLRQKT